MIYREKLYDKVLGIKRFYNFCIDNFLTNLKFYVENSNIQDFVFFIIILEYQGVNLLLMSETRSILSLQY